MESLGFVCKDGLLPTVGSKLYVATGVGGDNRGIGQIDLTDQIASAIGTRVKTRDPAVVWDR